MNKKLVTLLLATVVCFSMTACGKEEANNDSSAVSEITETETSETVEVPVVEGEGLVELKDYKNNTVEVSKYSFSEEEIEEYMNYFYQMTAKSYDWQKTAEMGDTVIIDFVGEVDGVAFEGGSAEDYSIVLGSHTFFDPFEERMVGMSIGDVWPLDLQFPDDYWSEDLAGKPCIFTVTCKAIIPPISDDNIKAFQIDGCETVEDFRKYSTDVVNSYFEDEYTTSVVAEVLKIAMANSVFGAMPEDRLAEKLTEVNSSYLSTATSMGLDVESYLAQYGTSSEELATNMLKRDLIFEAIKEAENLSVSDEEIDEYVLNVISAGNLEMTLDEYYETDPRDNYREVLLIKKIYDFIVNNNTVVEPSAATE